MHSWGLTDRPTHEDSSSNAAVFLDLPNPWEAIESAKLALKVITLFAGL